MWLPVLWGKRAGGLHTEHSLSIQLFNLLGFDTVLSTSQFTDILFCTLKRVESLDCGGMGRKQPPSNIKWGKKFRNLCLWGFYPILIVVTLFIPTSPEVPGVIGS